MSNWWETAQFQEEETPWWEEMMTPANDPVAEPTVNGGYQRQIVDYFTGKSPASEPDPEAPRDTTLGEKAGGLALDLGIGTLRATKAIPDLASFVLPDAVTDPASEFFERGIDAAEALKPEAYKEKQQQTFIGRDENGEFKEFQLPSLEHLAGITASSIPMIPYFLVGGGAAATGLKALPYLKQAPKLAEALGFGVVNAAMVAPDQWRQTYQEAIDAGMDDAEARDSADAAALMTAAISWSTGAGGGALAAKLGAESGNIGTAIAKGFVGEAPFEGIEESGQSIAGDIALGRPINQLNALDAGLSGFGGGGVPGAGIAAMEYLAKPNNIPTPPASPTNGALPTFDEAYNQAERDIQSSFDSNVQPVIPPTEQANVDQLYEQLNQTFPVEPAPVETQPVNQPLVQNMPLEPVETAFPAPVDRITQPTATPSPVLEETPLPDATGALTQPEPTLSVTWGNQSFPVASIEDAQSMWNQFRTETGAGASEIGSAKVVDSNGTDVGKIAYNGRFIPAKTPTITQQETTPVPPVNVPEVAPVEPANVADMGTTEPSEKPAENARFIERKQKGYEKSSTQVNLEGPVREKVLSLAQSIPDSDVYEKTDENGREFGREDEPHVTVLYGITEESHKNVAKALKDHGDVEFTLGKTSVFENDDYDVLKADVEGASLRSANKALSDSVQFENDYPDYKPHVTIAYLKKGTGKKYAELTDLEGTKISASEIQFSSKNGERFAIDTGTKAVPQTTEQAPQPTDKITDFGEKIGGARKDVAKFNKALEDISSDDDIGSLPLSKVWPDHDYQKMREEGVDPKALAMVKVMRDEVPAKPRQAWKKRRYVEQVKTLRGLASDLLNGKYNVDEIAAKMEETPGLKKLVDRYELLAELDMPEVGAKFKKFDIRHGEFSYFGGKEHKPPVMKWYTLDGSRIVDTYDTRAEALEALRQHLQTNVQKRDNKTKFATYQKRGESGVWIGKKVGRGYIDLKHFESEDFTRKDGKPGKRLPMQTVRDYMETNHDELVALLKKKKHIAPHRDLKNRSRIGEDRRAGQMVTPEQFSDTFGFRGVEFGNWVEQGKRQESLDRAYDALLDLTDVLGIPPKAISLNGQLGLAFGARGKGGKNPAAAHYEPDRVVINLTKKNGPGSLAHELWHAMDNYFSRKRGKPTEYLTARPFALVGKDADPTRPEMIEAFKNVMDTIRKETDVVSRSRSLDKRRTKDYWSTDIELSARAFEAYVKNRLIEDGRLNDYLANISSYERYEEPEAYPYPTPDEIGVVSKAFDRFFQTVKTRETDAGVELYSRNRDSEKSGLSASDIKSVIDNKTGLTSDQFEVVQSQSEMPEGLEPLLTGSNQDKVEGMFDPRSGKVYIIADNISTLERAIWVPWHEQYHRGVRVKHGDKLDAKLDEAGKNTFVSRLANAILRDRTDKNGNVTDPSLTGPNARRVAVEEALAELNAAQRTGDYAGIQKRYKLDVPTAQQATWRGVVARFYEWLTKVFRNITGSNVSNADVFKIVRGADMKADAQAYRDSVEEGLDAAPAMASRAPKQTQSQDFSNFTLPTRKLAETMKDDSLKLIDRGLKGTENIRLTARQKIQDKMIPIRRIQEAIEKTGATISDFANVYAKEQLLSGRVEHQFNRMEYDDLAPLVALMTQHGVSRETLGKYLYARHAKARNELIRTRVPYVMKNGEMVPQNDSGSGMTDEEADKILNGFRKDGQLAGLKEMAAIVDRITAKTRQNYRDYGLLDKTVLDSWEEDNDFNNTYVPLRGFAESVEEEFGKPGRGFDIRGDEVKRALGRTTEPGDIIGHVLSAYKLSVIRGEKNRVGQALLQLAVDNPNDNLWEINPVETKAVYDEKTGMRVERTMADMNDPNVFYTKVNGKSWRIELKDERMSIAMKNLGADNMNALIRGLSTTTRYLSLTRTMLSPEFILTNFMRDIQTAGINLDGEQGKAIRKAAINRKAITHSIRAMFNEQRDGAKGDPEWRRYAREYTEDGGRVAFFRAESVEELARKVDRMSRMSGKDLTAKGYRGVKATFKLIEDMNLAVENAVRLTAYKAAREAGVSRQDAAIIAKNLTVNFNRRGTAGPGINAFYMFANASIQGSQRTLQAAKNPRVQKILLASAGFGALMTIFNELAGGEDDDGESYYSKIPDFEKGRKLILMIPDGINEWVRDLPFMNFVDEERKRGAFLTIHLPYGYSVPYVMGEAIASTGFGTEPTEAAMRIIHAANNSFNPVGSDSIATMVAPTLADPFVELWRNKNFWGGPIHRGENVWDKTPAPKSEEGWTNTAGAYKWVAKKMNEWSGGSEVRPGWFDYHPETYRHFFEFTTGGTGSFFERVIDNIDAAMSPDRELEVRRVPFLRSFFGTTQDFADRDRYEAHVKELGYLKDEQKVFREQVRKGEMSSDRYDEWEKDHEDVLSSGLIGRADNTEKAIRKLYKTRKTALENGDKERVKRIEEDILRRQIDFNTAYNEIMLDKGWIRSFIDSQNAAQPDK